MTFKELRQASGMNLQQFCKYFRIPTRTAQHWEAGDRKCPEYLLALMQYKLETEKSNREYIREKMAEGITIKEICEKYNKTPAELSRMFNIPIATVQSWYEGQCDPPGHIANGIRNILQSDKERRLIVKKTKYTNE